MRTPLSLFAGLNSPSTLSIFSWERCPSPLITFVTLPWTVSSSSISLLHWGAHNWTQHSNCGLTSAELTGRISFYNLLAALRIMQPRTPFAFCAARACCWLVFSLVSSSIPSSFLWSAFQLGGPQVVPPQAQDFVVPCVKLNPSVLDPSMLVQVFCCDTIKQAGELKNPFGWFSLACYFTMRSFFWEAASYCGYTNACIAVSTGVETCKFWKRDRGLLWKASVLLSQKQCPYWRICFHCPIAGNWNF